MKFTGEQEQPVRAFSRASVAYKDGQEIAIDEADERYAVLPSTSDGEFVGAVGEGSVGVYPMCVAAGVLYAIDSNLKCQKSTDGTTWERTESNENLQGLVATPGGHLLGWVNTGTPAQFVLKRSTDGGDTFDDVTPTGDNAPAAAGQLNGWCIRDNGSTMLLCEYSSGSDPLSGRYIFRSVDDGVTWVRVLDADDLTDNPDYTIRHWHNLCYHAATGRWIAAAGDGQERRGIFYSDDDGLTWQRLTDEGNGHAHPVGMVDYGDDTYLVSGSDDPSTICKVNVLTGEVVSVFNKTLRTQGNLYHFSTMYHDGVFYEIQSPTSGTFDLSIMASRDLVNWTVVHRFLTADAVGSATFPGVFFAGKIRFTLNNTSSKWLHFQFRPPTLIKVPGIVVTGAATNLCAENRSSFDTAQGSILGLGSTIGGVLTNPRVDDAYHGNRIVRLERGTMDSGSLRQLSLTTGVNLTVGKTYMYMAYMRNTTGNLVVSPRLSYGSSSRSAIVSFLLHSDWQLVFTHPYTVVEGETDGYRMYIYFDLVDGQEIGIELDAAQLIELPYTPWQLESAARAADVLTETVTPGKLWTDVFAVQTLLSNEYYAADDQLVIKTWALDANNKIDIVYDPSDAKIKLIRTIAGSAQTAVASSAQYWNGDACLKFALRVSSDAVKLDIQNGRAIETLSDDGMSALLDAEIVGTYGDFPMVVLTGWQQARFIPLWIADADVVKVFNLEIPDYAQRGGVEMAGFISGRGFIG